MTEWLIQPWKVVEKCLGGALEAGYFEADVESSTDKMAACAYQLADAMIKARG
ncbi:hypothetical protein [Yersinia intermedia]|uniref:hypothetical protein n=1 Tax=Yersinia intermedia TaxID=631 RepID=UPI0005AD5CF7|nr:hypothetical protein [Yersinia intermedia]AJJ20848.1 hypothetical protein CH53_4206 [Yersinia intermedia]